MPGSDLHGTQHLTQDGLSGPCKRAPLTRLYEAIM
jgi:hypothetical protein